MAIPRPNWFALAARVDKINDDWFSEPVELHPWTTGGVQSGGGPDPNRSVLVTNGMYMKLRGSLVSFGQAMGGNARTLSQETWLSIAIDNLGGSIDLWKTNDRVYFPDRGEWWLINYIEPSDTYRPNVHLTRLNDQALRATLRQAKPLTTAKSIKGRLRGVF